MTKPPTKVALIRCESYDYIDVRDAVKRGVSLLGGAGRFVKKGQRLLLKPNLLVGEPPERCVTTHPSVFSAAAELFLETGAVVSFGDSPGFGSMSSVAGKCGILGAAESLSIGQADFKNGTEVFFKDGRQNKNFYIANAILENDIIISLPKLKTHGMQKFTGCVKNQFGCIPGLRKSEYHVKLPDAEKFAQLLVDLNNYVHPALYIMDGIYAMEGNGPRGGRPRRMNILLFSSDPIAIDSTVCRLINLDPEYIPTIKYGYESGSGTYLESEIELLGDDLEGFIQPAFDIDRNKLKAYRERGIFRFLSNRLVPKPYIVKERCVECGICVKMCPTSPKSVKFGANEKNPPVHDYKTCIRCYCCQEVCPEGAIHLKLPLLRRIFGRKK